MIFSYLIFYYSFILCNNISCYLSILSCLISYLTLSHHILSCIVISLYHLIPFYFNLLLSSIMLSYTYSILPCTCLSKLAGRPAGWLAGSLAVWLGVVGWLIDFSGSSSAAGFAIAERSGNCLRSA